LTPSNQYVLGHSDSELKRLTNQARLIDPITARFLFSAGIGQGMRVLDVGSGMGDVAMVVSRLVGPHGFVVGADMAEAAVAAARQRIQREQIGNVAFLLGDPAEMIFEAPFDCVVGRYVLQFMPDPAASLARLARHLRPGGVIVFHELDWAGARSAPIAPTYDLACRWVDETIARNFAQSRLGPRLASLFRKAGLRPASMQLEAVIASGSSAVDVVRLVTELIETLLPAMERSGVVSQEEVGLPTLESRILEEVGPDGTLIARAEVAGWTTV
jgi:2-polyprenyl-3-methyl-5-hydroxy-6-metoxy-1,4-benzoquinol methylase